MCRFCLHGHNSVSFIPLKYVKFNLPCKYLLRGMNAKHDVIYTSGYVYSLAVMLIRSYFRTVTWKVNYAHATFEKNYDFFSIKLNGLFCVLFHYTQCLVQQKKNSGVNFLFCLVSFLESPQ